MKTKIPSIRLLALAGAAAFLACASASRAQVDNLPTNLTIDSNQTTSATTASQGTSTASNDGTTRNTTALNYSNSRNDTSDNAMTGVFRINRNITASAKFSYDGAATLAGTLNAYGSRSDGSDYSSDSIYSDTAGGIGFTISSLAPYTLNGSFVAAITSGSPQITGLLMLADTSTNTTIFNESYTTTTSANDPFTNNLTGILAPGTYSLTYDAESLFDAGDGNVSEAEIEYTFEVGTVPEPSTWVLLALGGAVLVGWTLRRRRA